MKRKTTTNILTLITLVLVCALTFVQGRIQEQKYGVPNLSTQEAVDLYTWDEETAPNYVAYLGTSEFELYPVPGKYEIETDASGRPARVLANVTYDMMKEGSERERDDLPNPVGWPKNKEVDIITPDGTTYHGWFWNRSHLLAKSLGGPDTKDNLVTGTRMQNVGANVHPGGMAYAEDKARRFLAQNQSETIIYQVQPVYYGDEKIPRTVIIDMLSSDGKIDEQLLIYNAQKGFDIDYETGTFTATANALPSDSDIQRFLESLFDAFTPEQ